MPNELFNTCPVCNTQTELSKEDFKRGTYTCQSCLTVNYIDTKNTQPVSGNNKIKRKAIPLPKPVCYFISILQTAIVGLSLYSLFAFTLPDNISYSLPVVASMFAFWLQKIKMGYSPFIKDNEYEVNPKDVLRQEGYNDPFVGLPEEYRRHKAEKETGRKFTQKEWDEYYDKYQEEHPPMELTWSNIKNKFSRKKKNQ